MTGEFLGWVATPAGSDLYMGERLIASVAKSETGAVWTISVDPARGIQRVNEAMKLSGSVLGSEGDMCGDAKVRVHAMLSRFGFSPLVPDEFEDVAKPAPVRKSRKK